MNAHSFFESIVTSTKFTFYQVKFNKRVKIHTSDGVSRKSRFMGKVSESREVRWTRGVRERDLPH